MITVDINPVPKPRMTRGDKWKKRPVVQRYWAFKAEWRMSVSQHLDLNFCGYDFVVQMPKSWSKKKKEEMNGTFHTQTPDLDNLLKAVLDAHYDDDSRIHTVLGLTKRWGYEGEIVINEIGDDLPW